MAASEPKAVPAKGFKGIERLWWAAVGLLSVALALLVTWPMVLDPVGQVVGHSEASVACHVWVIWWAQHHLSELSTNLIFFPHGADIVQLYGSDLLSPLLLGMVPAPPVLLYNLWVLLLLTTGGMGAAFLARHMGAHPWACLVATVVFETAPFLQHELLNGTSELLAAATLPWFIAMLYRTLASPTVRNGVLVGGIAGIAFALSVYNLFFVLAVLFIALLHRAATNLEPIWTPPLLKAVGAAAAVGSLFAVPIAGLHLTHGAGDTFARRGDWLNIKPPLPDMFADALAWFDPRATEIPVMYAAPLMPELEYWTTCTVYLGFVTLALAAAGLLRKTRRDAVVPLAVVAWMAAVGVLIASGPTLRAGGQEVRLLGQALALPGQTIAMLFPPFVVTAMHSYRYAVLVVVALSALAARGAGRAWWAVMVLVAVEAMWVAPVPWPAHTTVVPRSPVLERLAKRPDGAVLTAPSRRDNLGDLGRMLMAQTVHGKPVQDGGMHHRAGEVSTAMFRDNAAVSDISGHIGPDWSEPLGAWTPHLYAAGYRYVLVPADHYEGRIWVHSTLGIPTDTDDHWALWPISAPDSQRGTLP